MKIINKRVMFILIFFICIMSINIVFADSIDNNQLERSDTFINSSDYYTCENGNYFEVVLIDNASNVVSNKNITFTVNEKDYSKITDENGIAKLQINLNPGNYLIKSSFKGDELYNESFAQNILYVRDIPTNFVDKGVSNQEIQEILDSSAPGSNIEFLGEKYDNISLNINKELNIFSNVNSELKGLSNYSVFKINSFRASNTKISGFNISGSKKGIEVISGANDILIKNNKFDDNRIGIYLKDSNGVKLINNTINSSDEGIYLKNTKYTVLTQNNISKCMNGIYFNDKNVNTYVTQNNIFKSHENGILLEDEIENINILYNNISRNNIGLYLNCKFNDLNISSNSIIYNNEFGIDLGEGYRKDDNYNDFILAENSILNNEWNLEAKKTIYNEGSIKFNTYNWVGSTSSSFRGICPKISVKLYSLYVSQADSGSINVSVGIDGKAATSLGYFPFKFSSDGGSTWQSTYFSNGGGIIHISNYDGKIIINEPEGNTEFALKDYIPYKPDYKPDLKPQPKPTPQPEQEPETTSSNTNNTERGGGASPTNDENILDISESNKDICSPSENNDFSQNEDKVSSSKSSSSASKRIAKSLTIDEEVVKIAGVGILILIIILIIALYYSKDIKNMINKRKEE